MMNILQEPVFCRIFFKNTIRGLFWRKEYKINLQKDFQCIIRWFFLTTHNQLIIFYMMNHNIYGTSEVLQIANIKISFPAKNEWIWKKSNEVSRDTVAAIPCTYLTTLQVLRNKAAIKQSCKVLVYGAAGGVRTAAIQLAKFCYYFTGIF